MAKGLCILLVVLVHSNLCEFWGFPNGDIPNFGALRMPLYFVLSGLFFKDYGSLGAFFEKKVNKIFIPFVFWYLISFAVIYLANKLFRGGAVSFSHIADVFHGRDFINIALWFLLCLFWTNCIFALLRKCLRNDIILGAAALLSGGIGIVLSANRLELPFFFDAALTAIPFFYFGFLMGRTPILYPNRFDRWSLPLGLVCISAAYAIYFFAGENMFSYRDNLIIGHWALAYLNAFLMVLGVLFICKTIGRLPVVSYFGRYSVIVLCIHWLILANLGEAVVIIFGIHLNPVVNLLCTLAIVWFLIPLIRTYLGHFTAQKDLIKFHR